MNELLETTLKRYKAFEPAEGYYGAFSGGKDSQALYECAKLAGVKVDWHFHRTSVDPPQLLRFIRAQYPDVAWDSPKKTMFQLILKNKMLPTRLIRFCCSALKEHGGEGRVVLVGVRAQESVKRSRYNMVEACRKSHRHLVRPLLDWKASDVWQLLSDQHLAHCELYDPPYNFRRIGCIGCPMTGKKMWKDFRHFPRHKQAYLNTIRRLQAQGQYAEFNTPEDVLRWWIAGESRAVFLSKERQQVLCFD